MLPCIRIDIRRTLDLAAGGVDWRSAIDVLTEPMHPRSVRIPGGEPDRRFARVCE